MGGYSSLELNGRSAKATEVMMSDPATQGFMQKIDPSSVKMLHLEQMKNWKSSEAARQLTLAQIPSAQNARVRRKGGWGNSAAPERNQTEASPRRPARSEQSNTKKFSFPFRRKNRRAHIRKREENFLWGQCGFPARRRGGFLSFVQRKFEQSV